MGLDQISLVVNINGCLTAERRWLEQHRKRSSLCEEELKGGRGKNALRMPNRLPEESPEEYAVRICKLCCDPLYECEVLMQQRYGVGVLKTGAPPNPNSGRSPMLFPILSIH